MSFLTPVRLKDASRVLRGVALVAAKAAAESPILRRAGEGDFTAAAQEALKTVSQQSRQLAEILDAASREQTGASVEQHLRRGQQVGEELASMVSGRAQGAFDESRRAAQDFAGDPAAATNRFAQEGRDAAEAAVASAQDAAALVRQRSSQAAAGAAAAGQDAAEAALRRGSEGLRRGRKAADVGAPAEQALGSVADVLSAQADVVSGRPRRTYLAVDFSSGFGSATSGSRGPASMAQSVTPQAGVAGSTSAGNLYAQTEGGSLELTGATPTTPPPGPSRPVTAAPAVPALDSRGPEAQGSERGEPAGTVAEAIGQTSSSTGATSQATLDAAAVLHERSSDGATATLDEDVAPSGPAKAEAAKEASQLVEEERKLSQKEAEVSGHEKAEVQAKKEEVRRKLRERSVPASPFGRVAGFAQLGASLVYGTVADQVSSYFGGGEQRKPGTNKYLTERNAERLADALCRMRGAALKLGQMLSIQDENVLPPQLTAALERVRAGADVMPKKQLQKVLTTELGPAWREKLHDFEDEPLAAASIGQVHGATLHDGRRVVLKIQYPGVARSIESDVDNLLRIINLANILPKGLYVENAAKVAKRELKLECDYAYEARCQTRFQQLIRDDVDFKDIMSVPAVVPELSSSSVLCTEWVPGVHIDKVAQMPQSVRNAVGTLLLQLTLRELFAWRFMQTDPNWGNFLYDERAGRLHLIDFGAAREFPVGFVDDYLNMVRACAEQDEQGVIDCSTRLGFLTGDESKTMMQAHAQAGFVVGTPFSRPGLYDFADHHSLTKQVSELGAVMLKHRLTPPPEESYSLHRKLSGAFLACIKLRARVPCRELFYTAYERHTWGHQGVTADDLPELQLASG